MSNIKTFKDLSSFTNAFFNYDTIANMKIKKIPKEYHNILSDTCLCGAEMIITNDLTDAQCCDPYCKIKMGYNLAYFINYLGYKGFGSTLCSRIYDEIYTDDMYPSFLVAFQTPESTLYSVLGDSNTKLFLSIRDDIKEKGITFRDSIASLGIPNIGDKSKIFDYMTSPADIIGLILHEKINDFLDDIGLSSLMYKYAFAAFAPSIAYLYSNIVHNVLIESENIIYIAITGEVFVDGVYYTRKRFLELCTSFTDAEGVPFYNFKETLDSRKLQWVIADRPSNSAKYKKGETLGCIISANEFISKIKSKEL